MISLPFEGFEFLLETIVQTDFSLFLYTYKPLTRLHSEQPKLHGVLAVLSAIGLNTL